jgi:hypothetical protein
VVTESQRLNEKNGLFLINKQVLTMDLEGLIIFLRCPGLPDDIISLILSYTSPMSYHMFNRIKEKLKYANPRDYHMYADIKDLKHLPKNALDLDIRNAADISLLMYFLSLQTLKLRGCYNLLDLGPLIHLSSLTTLYLNYCNSLLDVSPLSNLTGLRILYLS